MTDEGHRLVYRSLLWWICILAAIYLTVPGSIYFVHSLELSDIINPESQRSTIFLGTFNKNLFTPISVGVLTISGILLSILLIWLGGSSIDSTNFVENQFFAFTIVSITLLGLFIGTTGCFLDSPFSGAISIYLGSILLLHKNVPRRKGRLVAIFIYAIMIMLAPYLIALFVDGSLFIFEWSNEWLITLLRLLCSVVILVFTTISAFKTSERVSKLKTPIYA